MKKWIALLICMIAMISVACAEENVLRIAITTEEDAINWPTEEAFFLECPDMEIEYILYSEEQLNARIQAGTTGADLVILPYQNLAVLEEKGYLTYLDDAAGLTEYPKQIIDLSSLLEKNGRLFALPVSIGQDFRCWDESAGDAIGLTWPGSEAWTWKECARLAEEFPKDTDNDGSPDIWFMTGVKYLTLPAFENVNTGMFEEYLKTHTDFSLFMEQYLDIFRSFMHCDGLLDMDHFIYDHDCVLLSSCTNDNPMSLIDRTVENETGILLFLPPPVLDKNDVKYPGYLSGCAVLKDAKAPDKAAAYVQTMISEEALDSWMFGDATKLISAKVPGRSYSNMPNEKYLPVFEFIDGIPVFRLGAGREFEITDEFEYSEEAFNEAQKYRSLLTVDSRSYERDFYREAYSVLHEWYLGHIDDNSFAERMNYLLGIAANRK